jgi:hypothetical protein
MCPFAFNRQGIARLTTVYSNDGAEVCLDISMNLSDIRILTDSNARPTSEYFDHLENNKMSLQVLNAQGRAQCLMLHAISFLRRPMN